MNAIAARAMQTPRRPASTPKTEPFRDAEQAWFWTMGALAARRDGARRASAGVPRPCDPDDVVKCLDGLYRRRRVDLVHARILRIWGERQAAPNPAYAAERSDAAIWREALDRLEWPLRVKGIVA
ncbi:MAG TPA: hypothetical protein VGC80_01695 [Acetobacteraceae bacterium]